MSDAHRKRIVEGEMWGAPVPGGWPGGTKNGTESRTPPQPRRLLKLRLPWTRQRAPLGERNERVAEPDEDA